LVRVGKAKCSRVDAVLSLGIHREICVVTDGKCEATEKTGVAESGHSLGSRPGESEQETAGGMGENSRDEMNY